MSTDLAIDIMDSIQSLRSTNRLCTDCSLRAGCKQVVPLQLPTTTSPHGLTILAVGEAPGFHEDRLGVPFVGNSGNDLNHYLSYMAGIERDSIYLSNLIHCHPPADRDPLPVEIAACRQWLDTEISLINPDIILAMGRYSCRRFLGNDFDMDKGHGIPKTWNGATTTVFPMYHPAAGLHDRAMLQHIQNDLRALGRFVRGEYIEIIDEHSAPVYKLHDPDSLRSVGGLAAYLVFHDTIAIDTETAEHGRPWCFSISGRDGTGVVIMADDKNAIDLVSHRLNNPDCLAVMHNALFDLPILASMGIVPASYTDTMVKAYLLGDQPQRLKSLAYRLCGMEMRDYQDMIAEVSQRKALDYIATIAGMGWPDSPKEKVWSPDPRKEKVHEESWVPCTNRHKDATVMPDGSCSRKVVKCSGSVVVVGTERGYWRDKQPQNIATKATRLLTDWNKLAPIDGEDDTDVRERWGNFSDSEAALVEDKLGPIPQAYLHEIKLDDAVYYSGRDADATLRVNGKLDSLISKMDLAKALEVDTAIIPLLGEMMKNGMAVDLSHFEDLSVEYSIRLQAVHDDIADLFPASREEIQCLNLHSPDIITWLLYDKCKLTPPAFTKKTGKPSTANEDLSKLRSLHPIVPLILKHRELSKLKQGFVDAIPKLVHKDGRVHPTIRSTRVVTGRLSCAKPNLMQIPSRSEEAENIKRGFIAAPEHVILSADYSGIEMRCLADQSRDERMLKIFLDGGDMHTINAALLFGVSEEEVVRTKENKLKYRYPAKTLGFGIVYGLTATGLVDQLAAAEIQGYDEQRAQELINKYFGLYPGVKSYFKDCERLILRDGYARESCLGRIRLIPGAMSSLRWVKEASLREGQNHYIQGMAQGIIKLAMTGVLGLEYVRSGKARPLMQVHDSLLFEVDEDSVEGFSVELRELMENAYPLSIPAPVDVKWGRTWGEAA